MIEEWRQIQGFEGLYDVSNLGRVKSVERRCAHQGHTRRVPERVLKVTNDPRGYAVVTLSLDSKNNTRRVHILVARAFLGAAPDGMEVNHRDNNRGNSCIDNLFYGTHLENMDQRQRDGRTARGDANGRTKLSSDDVREIRRLRGVVSTYALADRFGVSYTSVWQAQVRKTFKHVEDGDAASPSR